MEEAIGGTGPRSRARRAALALLALVVAWSFLPAPTQAHAAGTYEVKTDEVKTYWGKQLNFGATSPAIKWTGKSMPTHTTLTNKKWSDKVHAKVPAIKPGADGGTWSNLLEETFENVCTYDGRQIDAKVTFKKVSVGKRYSEATQNSDGYMALSYTDGKTLFIGSSSASGSEARPWRAKKTWDMSIDLIWHDTKKKCTIPFLMDVRDIDQVNSYNAGTDKKPNWKIRWRESFSCDRTRYDRWVFPQNLLTPTKFDDKKGTNTFSCPDRGPDDKSDSQPSGLNLGGDDQLKKGGLYVVSTDGNFTFTYGGGNCLMKVKIYTQAQANPGAPRKGALVTD